MLKACWAIVIAAFVSSDDLDECYVSLGHSVLQTDEHLGA